MRISFPRLLYGQQIHMRIIITVAVVQVTRSILNTKKKEKL